MPALRISVRSVCAISFRKAWPHRKIMGERDRKRGGEGRKSIVVSVEELDMLVV